MVRNVFWVVLYDAKNSQTRQSQVVGFFTSSDEALRVASEATGFEGLAAGYIGPEQKES